MLTGVVPTVTGVAGAGLGGFGPLMSVFQTNTLFMLGIAASNRPSGAGATPRRTASPFVPKGPSVFTVDRSFVLSTMICGFAVAGVVGCKATYTKSPAGETATSTPVFCGKDCEARIESLVVSTA